MTGPPITLVVAGCAAGASTVLGLVVWLGPSSSDGVAFEPLLTGLAWLAAALALGFAAGHVRQVLEHHRVLGARVALCAASRAASRSMPVLAGACSMALVMTSPLPMASALCGATLAGLGLWSPNPVG